MLLEKYGEVLNTFEDNCFLLSQSTISYILPELQGMDRKFMHENGPIS
jgi:hypothetical protein